MRVASPAVTQAPHGGTERSRSGRYRRLHRLGSASCVLTPGALLLGQRRGGALRPSHLLGQSFQQRFRFVVPQLAERLERIRLPRHAAPSYHASERPSFRLGRRRPAGRLTQAYPH